MQTFTKRVLIDEGFNPAFFFTKICTLNGVRFHVSVIDLEDQAHNFNMDLKGEQWRIINCPLIPDWIIDVEKQLQEIIIESTLN